MRTNQAARSSGNLVDKPERIGPALAQVIRIDDNGREELLGQAWLAAPNRLITCGHVIEPFMQYPLSVLFPSTSKRYPVLKARLHPSFVRQPDGLVKFDVAMLTVDLDPPESQALPLPFSYEQSLRTNQRLWTIRYPVHLAQLSAALEPLSQEGRFLGLLRKHDSFHLLHDLPLSPGDSGAPICDAGGIVAIHCGDTATLPGLNLPTTSIRLALWVDSLRELGLVETKKTYINHASKAVSALIVFAVMFGIAFGAGQMIFSKPQPKPTQLVGPVMKPLGVSFNMPLDQYKKNQPIEITLHPKSPIYPFLLLSDTEEHMLMLFPADDKPQELKESLVIDQGVEGGNLEALKSPNVEPITLYVLAIAANDPTGTQLAKEFKPIANFKHEKGYLIEPKVLERIRLMEKQHPALVALAQYPIPPGK